MYRPLPASLTFLTVSIVCADRFYVVTNAARRDADLPWLEARRKEWNQKESGRSVEIEVLEDWGLVALQGKNP